MKERKVFMEDQDGSLKCKEEVGERYKSGGPLTFGMHPRKRGVRTTKPRRTGDNSWMRDQITTFRYGWRRSITSISLEIRHAQSGVSYIYPLSSDRQDIMSHTSSFPGPRK